MWQKQNRDGALSPSDSSSRIALLVKSSVGEDCVQSLEVIASTVDLIAFYENRLDLLAEQYASALDEQDRRMVSADERIAELEAHIEQQDQEYVALATLLERKVFECSQLKASIEQTRNEAITTEQQIRAMTRYVTKLQEKLRTDD